MVRRILVPLDGSTFAESALPMALSIARRSQSELELVIVHEPVPTFAYHEWENAAREWSESYLSEVRKRIASSVDRVETTVRSGRVSEALVRRARDTAADLVVMATHGRGAFTRTWLGSVADAFLRHAPCPVLLVRPDEEGSQEVTGDPVPDSILVPLDGSELSTAILDHVTDLALLFGSRIVLLRVVAYPVEIASPYLPHTVRMNQEIVEEAKIAAEEYLGRVAGPLEQKGPEVDIEVCVDTQAGNGILRIAQERDVGLIAMSTHGRGGVARALLGSTADKVIRGAHRPILVYRPEE